MRALIGAVAVLAFAGFAAAQKDEKIDGKKLVGKWEQASAPKGAPKMTVEFTDKGKMTLSIDAGGKAITIEGTYKVDGNKLEMVLKADGKEEKETVTITKLTDTELAGKDSKGMEEKFVRVKAK